MAVHRYLDRTPTIRSMQLGYQLKVSELLDRISVVSDNAVNAPRALVVMYESHNRAWYDTFSYIEALKVLPAGISEVVFYFVWKDAVDAGIFPHCVEEFLAVDKNVFVAYDETGMFDGVALLPTDALDISKTKCSFAGSIDRIDEELLDDIRYSATVQTEYEFANELSQYGFSPHVDGFAMSRMVETMGLGYVSYPLTRSIAEILNQGITGSNLSVAPQVAANIAAKVGEEMRDADNVIYLLEQSIRVSAAIRIWAAAVRNAGIPFVLNWCNSDDNQWHVDQNMLCKMAELLGVDTMMETHFIHGVPIDDVVA